MSCDEQAITLTKDRRVKEGEEMKCYRCGRGDIADRFDTRLCLGCDEVPCDCTCKENKR